MTETGTIRVVLADDHQMVRQALAQLLEDSPGIEVVGQAGDGQEAVKLVEATAPDVIVLDYSMPAMDAPVTIQALLRQHRQLRIVVLTVHESIHYAVRVLESGAHGYVVKSAAAQELVEAIRSAHRDEVYISPKVSQRVIQQLRRPKSDRVGVSALSPREFEMLRVLGSGMSLKECAGHLDITISTASTYRARLMEKLNLRSTAEIIRFALENEIVG
jgi:DNA-binding NarL/FixJ family response regulator